jgi:orotidine-5'-phosphate decarboxylase
MNNFRELALKYAKEKNSRIVLALDLYKELYTLPLNIREKERKNLLDSAINLLSNIEDYIAGIKIGLPFSLCVNLDNIEEIIKNFSNKYFFICDFKIADIGYTNSLIIRNILNIGFNAIIAHAIIGFKDGLERIVSEAKKFNAGVLALCAMSHNGAEEFINKHYIELLEIAAKSKVDGFILPATYPSYISTARKLYPWALIFSPGVGAQKAAFGSAINNGADFEIIGRSIYEAENPKKEIEKILKEMSY